MYARSVTAPSVGIADTATRYVLRRRFPVLVARRGSAERPRAGSRRPFGGSGLGIVHRCAVCQNAAADGATIDGTHRDANGRPWPAEPARARLSSEATPDARSATTDGQRRESADSTERERPTGGAEQESRAAGLDASPRRLGLPRPFGRRDASRVEWPATARTSNDFCPDAILARHRFLMGKRFLIHDRDPRFTLAFRETLTAAGVHVVRVPPRSPNLNAYAERFVRTIKESCLDRIIFVGEGSLWRAVREFIEHYHHERNHQGLGNQLILPVGGEMGGGPQHRVS